MPIEVTMPKLSPTMESGLLSEWKVKVGDTVREGDILAVVETDKSTMEMKSFDDGTVAQLAVAPGVEVAIGQLVMVLAKKGEKIDEVATSAQGSAPKVQQKAASAAQPAAADSAGNGQNVAVSIPTTPAEPTAIAGGRVKSSPLARKIAASAGVELSAIAGTGPGGRVIRRDVDAFVKAGHPNRASTRTQPVTAPRATERIPHSRMRKTIAARMLQAAQTTPVIHVATDIRLDRVVAARETINQDLAAEKIKLSIGDFITKAVALALREHPELNASFETEAIVRHGNVNIGIAVALEGGLIVPVLRDADQLGLREIRLGTEALANAARANKLTTDQMIGGTFTISNLGMYGVREFDAILNVPEVGILAVAAAEKRPVVEADSLVVGTVMTVTLTADHRAVDGATAAQFLRTLKNLLEEPAAMLL